MKKSRVAISMLLLLVLYSDPAWANDSAMGVSGATVFPVMNNNVRMVREHIRWSGRVVKHQLVGWDVRCEFVFKNETKKATSVLVGFPLVVVDEGDVNLLPGQKKPKVGEPLVVGFRTTVRGKVVKTRKKNVSRNRRLKGHSYKYAYVFKVRFKPRETVKIVHTFRGATTVSAMGSSHVSYVLKTGALWRGGRIGRSLVEIEPKVPFKLCSEAPRRMQLHRAKPTPAAYRYKGKRQKRKIVWDMKNVKPTRDVELCLLTPQSALYDNWARGPLSRKVKRLNKLSRAELRMLRNTIYAQRGYRFKSKRLRRFFAKLWWYFPDKAYRSAWLSKAHSTLLQKIRRIERGR